MTRPLAPRVRPSLISAAILAPMLALAACSKDDSAPSAAKAEGKAVKAEAGADEGQKRPQIPATGPDGKPLAKLEGGVVDLGLILQRTPEQAEKLLGEPQDSGGHESSCVRFLPERVFFKCEHDFRIYSHPKVERIRVDYQDGRAAVVELIGPKGEGAFSELAALEFAGLSLPGEATHDSPPAAKADERVDVWNWGNSKARLLINDKQYRVRVSTIDGAWDRAKIEVIDNTPLSEDQAARIMTVKGESASTPAQ